MENKNHTHEVRIPGPEGKEPIVLFKGSSVDCNNFMDIEARGKGVTIPILEMKENYRIIDLEAERKQILCHNSERMFELLLKNKKAFYDLYSTIYGTEKCGVVLETNDFLEEINKKLGS